MITLPQIKGGEGVTPPKVRPQKGCEYMSTGRDGELESEMQSSTVYNQINKPTESPT